jgi:hypothetical protein
MDWEALLDEIDKHKDAIEKWVATTMAEVAEAKRAARHHEIIKTVLPALIDANIKYGKPVNAETIALQALAAWQYAHAVYPNPKP